MNSKIVILILLCFSTVELQAQEIAKYVGSKKCKACHMANSRGNQYKKWSESPHAKAFATLGTELAKEYAQTAGVKGDPQKAGECLECHQTTHGIDSSLIDKGYVADGGVECESCHGPGSLYRKSTVMSVKKYKEKPDRATSDAVKLGLIYPNEVVCIKCHNERSPAFKGFNFEEYFAKISHPNPKRIK